MYKIVRTLLFFFPTESVHYFSMNVLKQLCKWDWSRKLVAWTCEPEEKLPNTGSGPQVGQGTAVSNQPEIPGQPGQGTTPGNQSSGPAVTNQPSDPTITNQPRSLATTNQPSDPTVSNQPSDPAVSNKPSDSTIPNQPRSLAITNQSSGSAVTNQPSGPGQPKGNSLTRNLFGLSFCNPVGLGAGFDKNALYLRELQALGFGFVEIGTVTPLAQDGNEKPRLFRLPEDQALINRMGFNNDGVKVIAQRLKSWRQQKDSQPGKSPLIIGGNIGKNKVTPNEDAWKDYEICFRELFDYVDYFVVNVSSPNTPGLRELQEKDALRKILTNLQAVNKTLALEKGIPPRPLLLKIAPDLSWSQIDDVVDLALEIRLDGLVATNTTISREKLLSSADRLASIGAGGLSGAPLKERSTEVIRYIHRKTWGSIPLIASGGIFTGEDAQEKIQAGAALVQVWTGFIYEGPFIIRRICAKL